jgi:hypothetical protein
VSTPQMEYACAEFSGTLLGFDDFVSMFDPLPVQMLQY